MIVLEEEPRRAAASFHAVPTAASVGSGVQAGGWAWGHESLQAQLSTHMHMACLAVCVTWAQLQVAGCLLVGRPRARGTSILGWRVHTAPLATLVATSTGDTAGLPGTPHCPCPSHWAGLHKAGLATELVQQTAASRQGRPQQLAVLEDEAQATAAAAVTPARPRCQHTVHTVIFIRAILAVQLKVTALPKG